MQVVEQAIGSIVGIENLVVQIVHAHVVTPIAAVHGVRVHLCQKHPSKTHHGMRTTKHWTNTNRPEISDDVFNGMCKCCHKGYRCGPSVMELVNFGIQILVLMQQAMRIVKVRFSSEKERKTPCESLPQKDLCKG